MMAVTGCPLSAAIDMASRKVARLNGLDEKGEIKPGRRADLIFLTLGESRLKIKQTLVAKGWCMKHFEAKWRFFNQNPTWNPTVEIKSDRKPPSFRGRMTLPTKMISSLGL